MVLLAISKWSWMVRRARVTALSTRILLKRFVPDGKVSVNSFKEALGTFRSEAQLDISNWILVTMEEIAGKVNKSERSFVDGIVFGR